MLKKQKKLIYYLYKLFLYKLLKIIWNVFILNHNIDNPPPIIHFYRSVEGFGTWKQKQRTVFHGYFIIQ